jgi:hypothetical protein
MKTKARMNKAAVRAVGMNAAATAPSDEGPLNEACLSAYTGYLLCRKLQY